MASISSPRPMPAGILVPRQTPCPSPWFWLSWAASVTKRSLCWLFGCCLAAGPRPICSRVTGWSSLVVNGAHDEVEAVILQLVLQDNSRDISLGRRKGDITVISHRLLGENESHHEKRLWIFTDIFFLRQIQVEQVKQKKTETSGGVTAEHNMQTTAEMNNFVLLPCNTCFITLYKDCISARKCYICPLAPWPWKHEDSSLLNALLSVVRTFNAWQSTLKWRLQVVCQLLCV